MLSESILICLRYILWAFIMFVGGSYGMQQRGVDMPLNEQHMYGYLVGIK